MPDNASRVLSFPAPSQTAFLDALMRGPSSTIARMWAQMARVAPHFRAALLVGETGSGLEAAARGLHALSTVARLRFRGLDAMRAEADLTAARTPALSGFLYFSQIEQVPLAAQRNLLRRLRQRDSSLRVVASTTGDLRAAVSAGRFDPALAEMLSAVRIAVPPLRERTEDLRLLIETMLARHGGLNQATEEFYTAASAFDWPGNFPQLRDVMCAALEIAAGGALDTGHFHAARSAAPVAQQVEQAPAVRMMKLDEIVTEHVRGVLVACGGNKLRAAEVLGISRSTLYRILDAASVSMPLAKAS